MLRRVRGLGSLTPSPVSTRQIHAETDVTAVWILKLSSSQAKAETMLVDMSTPQIEQAALDARPQLRPAEAECQSLWVRLQSDSR